MAISKGARLAETLYRDIGLRPFADIDFFVALDDWPKFEKILEKCGFMKDENFRFPLDPARRGLAWTFAPMYHKNGLLAEVHLNYLGLHLAFSSEDDLWRTAVPARIGEAEAKVFSEEYELCYLCLHAQQHSYDRLIWLTDIAEISSSGKVKWDKIQEICRKEKISASVFYGLFLANILWPGTVQVSILNRFEVTSFERKLLKLFWPEERVSSRKGLLQFPFYTPTFFSLLSRKKPSLAAKTFWHIYFPPRDWVACSYGIPKKSLKIYFHYLWRVARPVLVVSRKILRIG